MNVATRARYYIRLPRRDSRVPRSAATATSSDSQGNRSPRPPHSKAQGAWLCDEPYRYIEKASTNSLDKCNEVLKKQDENIYRQMKDEINFLMVVAGLLLAITAAFTIESYKFLQEDKQDTMSDLLVEVVRLLNDTSAQGNAQLPKPFTPKHHDILVNNLWFLSMILNLTAVAIGTFCLQWISAISRGSDLAEKSIPPHESLALRQLRREGLVGWGVLYAPEVLLFIVQLSIGLFTCGLVYFLWNVNKATAIPVLVAACLAGAFLSLINFLPFLQSLVGAFIPATLKLPQCPYKSPASWLIQSAGNMLPYIIKLFLDQSLSDEAKSVDRPESWLESLPLPFTDFNWAKYDTICQDLRQHVRPRLLYFQSGLRSALDHFHSEREVKDIIFGYLENLVPFLATTQDWEKFSSQALSDDDKFILNFQPLLNQQGYVSQEIRVDFLSALVLQHLTGRHNRLARLSLDRRVELYIRVKNSIPSGGPHHKLGQSLDCPCQGPADVLQLDFDLKDQFLKCVQHLIKTNRCNDLDIMSAAMIVQNELSGLRENLTSAEEGHGGAWNIQIGSLDNQTDPGTTSSPPNHPERGASKSATHDRASFTKLCSEVRGNLWRLPRTAFKNPINYIELRRALGLDVDDENVPI